MSRIYLAVLLFIATAYAADEECNCENMIEDDEKLWKYLKQMSIEVPEEDRSIYSVLPGVLSPLITCECDENNREKRKADSSEIPEVPESPEIPESEDMEMKHKLIYSNVHKRNCPRGHRRFGFICVLEEDLLQ